MLISLAFYDFSSPFFVSFNRQNIPILTVCHHISFQTPRSSSNILGYASNQISLFGNFVNHVSHVMAQQKRLTESNDQPCFVFYRTQQFIVRVPVRVWTQVRLCFKVRGKSNIGDGLKGSMGTNIKSKCLILSTSSFMTRFKAINSEVLSNLEVSSRMHCLRFDRGATPQISCKKEKREIGDKTAENKKFSITD